MKRKIRPQEKRNGAQETEATNTGVEQIEKSKWQQEGRLRKKSVQIRTSSNTTKMLEYLSTMVKKQMSLLSRRKIKQLEMQDKNKELYDKVMAQTTHVAES